jgi:hypothetical protein
LGDVLTTVRAVPDSRLLRKAGQVLRFVYFSLWAQPDVPDATQLVDKTIEHIVNREASEFGAIQLYAVKIEVLRVRCMPIRSENALA